MLEHENGIVKEHIPDLPKKRKKKKNNEDEHA